MKFLLFLLFSTVSLSHGMELTGSDLKKIDIIQLLRVIKLEQIKIKNLEEYGFINTNMLTARSKELTDFHIKVTCGDENIGKIRRDLILSNRKFYNKINSTTMKPTNKDKEDAKLIFVTRRSQSIPLEKASIDNREIKRTFSTPLDNEKIDTLESLFGNLFNEQN